MSRRGAVPPEIRTPSRDSASTREWQVAGHPSSGPVLDTEPEHPAEVLHVVRHQRQVERQGVRRDHRVELADRCSGSFSADAVLPNAVAAAWSNGITATCAVNVSMKPWSFFDCRWSAP